MAQKTEEGQGNTVNLKSRMEAEAAGRARVKARNGRRSQRTSAGTDTFYYGKRADDEASTIESAFELIEIALFGRGLTIGKEIIEHYKANPGYDRINKAVTAVFAKRTGLSEGLVKLVTYKATKALIYAERIARGSMQFDVAKGLLTPSSTPRRSPATQLAAVSV